MDLSTKSTYGTEKQIHRGYDLTWRGNTKGTIAWSDKLPEPGSRYEFAAVACAVWLKLICLNLSDEPIPLYPYRNRMQRYVSLYHGTSTWSYGKHFGASGAYKRKLKSPIRNLTSTENGSLQQLGNA